jgi:hypothetical protein
MLNWSWSSKLIEGKIVPGYNKKLNSTKNNKNLTSLFNDSLLFYKNESFVE